MSTDTSSAAASALFAIKDVSKQFGAVQALSNVSAEIPRGSYGLLGPNGAGKSTLIKALMGLIRPTGGTLSVLGLSPVSQAIDLRQRVGYMPEGDCYLEGLDAVQLCTYAAELCGLPPTAARQRANSVLNYVGLGDKRYLKVEGFSTGQKQRVKLAQAIVHDPELLFLDEPTNGLDPQGRNEMLALIDQLPKRRGCSIILSSHLLPDVEAVCDRVIVLSSGKLRYSGSIAEMRGQQDQFFEVRAKGQSPELVEALTAAGCGVEVEPSGMFVKLPEGANTDLIWRTAQQAGVQIRHLAPGLRSLESAFLDVLADAEGEN